MYPGSFYFQENWMSQWILNEIYIKWQPPIRFLGSNHHTGWQSNFSLPSLKATTPHHIGMFLKSYDLNTNRKSINAKCNNIKNINKTETGMSVAYLSNSNGDHMRCKSNSSWTIHPFTYIKVVKQFEKPQHEF